MSALRILPRIAFRNLFRSSLNLMIGGLIAGGTFLFVLGASLIGSLDTSLAQSITGSIAGDLHLQSGKATEDLSIWDDAAEEGTLPVIEDFHRLKPVLLSVENVREVLPMGLNTSEFAPGNTVDRALQGLRADVREKLSGGEGAAAAEARIVKRVAHLRQLVGMLQEEQGLSRVLFEDATREEDRSVLARVGTEAFWSGFESEPYEVLEFLENRLAPLLVEGELIEMRYVGTDLEAFGRIFDRMQIVEGSAVPPGRRGFLISQTFYEDHLKVKTAWRMDQLHRALAEGQKIAEEEELQQWIADNKNQTRELLLQLDPEEARDATLRLQRHLKSETAQLPALLAEFFELNDGNFKERHTFFYGELAPMLDLYAIRIGETITLRAFSRAGYLRSVNVPVYGTYQLQGMEKASFGGSVNLMDLVTFRSLLGHPSPDEVAEVAELKRQAGPSYSDFASAESALLSATADPEGAVVSAEFDETLLFGEPGGARRPEPAFTQSDVERGAILNAAIVLKDPSRADATAEAIRGASRTAGFDLKVLTGQQASGVLGQFVTLIRAVLFFVGALLFVVALVIINNAMMIAMLRRVKEIGTIRAIGGQRNFVVSMVLVEILLLGLFFGGAGMGAAAMVLDALFTSGIPAPNGEFHFIFGGPSLHPTVSATQLLVAMTVVVGITLISALYPAFAAARISPVAAMRSEE